VNETEIRNFVEHTGMAVNTEYRIMTTDPGGAAKIVFTGSGMNKVIELTRKCPGLFSDAARTRANIRVRLKSHSRATAEDIV
jgi:hypothetical protein